MKYNPALHNRRSIRLKGYDYSQAGLYFVTICIQNGELLLGEIENNEMILNDAGKMVQTEWEKLPERFPNVELHEFVVMPNHFQGILEIVGAIVCRELNYCCRVIKCCIKDGSRSTIPHVRDCASGGSKPPLGAEAVMRMC